MPSPIFLSEETLSLPNVVNNSTSWPVRTSLNCIDSILPCDRRDELKKHQRPCLNPGQHYKMPQLILHLEENSFHSSTSPVNISRSVFSHRVNLSQRFPNHIVLNIHSTFEGRTNRDLVAVVAISPTSWNFCVMPFICALQSNSKQEVNILQQYLLLI